MIKEIEFDREKVTDSLRFSNQMISDVNFIIGEDSLDLFSQTMTARIDAFFYTNNKEKVLTYKLKRPSFFDWIFRRDREVNIKINYKDVLIDPPKGIKTQRLYFTEIID